MTKSLASTLIESADAIQYTGKNFDRVAQFLKPTPLIFVPKGPGALIADDNFPMWVCPGEWVTVTLTDDLTKVIIDVWPDKEFRAATSSAREA